VPEIQSISAVTLVTRDMARAVRFYTALGFPMAYGGETAQFTSFRVGAGYLNLTALERSATPGWVRIIVYVDDVDAMYAHVRARGFTPEFAPRDAAWGERYFHVPDPDGYSLSFARRLPRSSVASTSPAADAPPGAGPTPAAGGSP
jgi:catechol 2,3-dioxygenase-like lactoylglutathione lyase family enzyme